MAALALDDGEVLTEGPAILQYMTDLRPASGLAPENGSIERVHLQVWLNFITSEIHAGSSLLFDRDLPKSVQDYYQFKAVRRIDVAEAWLEERNYLIGDRFMVADAYLWAAATGDPSRQPSAAAIGGVRH